MRKVKKAGQVREDPVQGMGHEMLQSSIYGIWNNRPAVVREGQLVLTHEGQLVDFQEVCKLAGKYSHYENPSYLNL